MDSNKPLKKCKHKEIELDSKVEYSNILLPGPRTYKISVTAKCMECGNPFAFPNKKGEPVEVLSMPMKPIEGYVKVKDQIREPLKSKPAAGVAPPPAGYGVDSESY